MIPVSTDNPFTGDDPRETPSTVIVAPAGLVKSSDERKIKNH